MYIVSTITLTLLFHARSPSLSTISYPSPTPILIPGQWWFDNMTLYLDTLLIIQQELADLINGQLEEIIQVRKLQRNKHK